MPISDYITQNTNLEVKNIIPSKKIILECTDHSKYHCPHCGSFSLRCKDTFIRNINSISIGTKATILRIKTHKYCCLDCGKYFNSKPQGVLRYQQTSEHLKKEIFHKHCQGVSKKDLGLDFGVSDSSIERWFQQGYWRKNQELKNARCPMILGIDEHHFSKSGGYATTLVNLSKHKVFDVILGRSEQELIPYLTQLQGKDKVRVVVMDLSSNYRYIVKKYFPNAMIVSDRFHVVRLALDSFIKTCYSLEKGLKKQFSLGRLLRKKRDNLEDWQRVKLEDYFANHKEIRVLYDTTQELMSLLNEKHCKYKDCKNRLVPKLLKFIEMLKSCGFEMFRKLGKTIENWSEEIGRMFRFTRSNGITEGFHRKMKLIQRRAYGFRNFENYRLRIRILCA